MSIVQSGAPANIGIKNPPLKKELFDEKTWAYGYDCLVYKAIECPCNTEGENTHLPTCLNCGGLGWTFINPLQTKALITSINSNTKYKEWSKEMLGTFSMTLRDVDTASFMDRVMLLTEQSSFTETRKVRDNDGSKFIYLSYPIVEVEDVFIFVAANQPLVRLSSSDYSISATNNLILNINSTAISSSVNQNISIRYKHNVQYNILDIPHLLRSSNKLNSMGQLEKVTLPRQYVVRYSHFVLGNNFSGGIQIDNTYR